MDLQDVTRFFPASVSDQARVVDRIAAQLADEDVAWISKNRDFGESERYASRDEVDATLDSSPAVREERTRIETLFSGTDPVTAARDYLALLRENLLQMHAMLLKGLLTLSEAPIEQHASFWADAARCSDVDRGGVLCHAAIVCREFQKPCVVGTTGATTAIATGQLITVCATRGVVSKTSS